MSYPEFTSEIGLSHKGDMGLLKEMMVSSKNAGAARVKLQVFDKEDYADEKIKAAWLSDDQIAEARRFAGMIGTDFFATPETVRHVELLDSMRVDWFKIAHNRCLDAKLLKAVHDTGKKVMISTQLDDYQNSVYTCKEIWEDELFDKCFFLHCVGKYPPEVTDLELDTVRSRDGYSNHFPSVLPCMIATVMGAKYIEVHVKAVEDSIDSQVSMSLTQLRYTIEASRMIRAMQSKDFIEEGVVR